MWELRRLKRYGFVNLGRYVNRDTAVIALTHITLIEYSYGDRFIGEDGWTYEVRYV